MITIIVAILAFVISFILMKTLPSRDFLLGNDRGKKFVEGSEANIGKPVGVGVFFTTVFAVLASALDYYLTSTFNVAILSSIVMISMITGLLDDRSPDPWGEYKKAFLDLLVALGGSIVFTLLNGSSFIIGLIGKEFTIYSFAYMILATILIIVSINATNCTDGVDGLSGTLTILSILTFMAVAKINGTLDKTGFLIGLIMIASLVGYLCFNIFPSKVLMGDAGSRALGTFIALYAMYLKIPLSYLIIGLPFLTDGGLSVLKITIGRITRKKIIILRSVITPFHDHMKKKLGFSVPKTYISIIIVAAMIDLMYIFSCFFIGL